ncbi:MAG: PA14 domain-containing protein, partial [Planctomycetota bacterium]
MIYRRTILMMTAFVYCFAAFAGAEAGNYRQGLAGTFFKGDDFTRPEDETHFLRSVDNDWGRSEGNNWSARWGGFIEGPYSGEVTFTARAVDGIRLVVGGEVVIDGLEDSNKRSGRVEMEKGKKVPVVVEFICLDGNAQLHLYWQWRDGARSIIPSKALSYDPAGIGDTSKEGMPGDDAEFPEIEVPPAGPEHQCVIKHVMVYDEPGRYAGWPANGGFWMWGDEMAVAFECGWFKDRPDWMDGHARDESRGNEDIVARSSDGGLNWTHKKYDIMSSDDGIRDIPEEMDFSNPGFGFKCQGERFYYTYDRGKNWFGPYRLRITGLPGADEDIESHTCYIINGKSDGYFFFGLEPDDAEDRFYCTRTKDGGRTFEFLGWISPPPENAPKYERWAVYSAVELSENHLIAALRRKINKRRGRIKRLNWIDVYESKDSGRTWNFLSKVADTD